MALISYKKSHSEMEMFYRQRFRIGILKRDFCLGGGCTPVHMHLEVTGQSQVSSLEAVHPVSVLVAYFALR